MRTDSEIRVLVEIELLLTSEVDSSGVDVTVHKGIVFLNGLARSDMEKYHIERAAMRVVGTACVASELEVRMAAVDEQTAA